MRNRWRAASVYPVEFRIITRGGEERWLEHVCQPVYGSNGNYLGRRGSNRDITERKRAEEALEEQAREKAVAAERSRLARELHDSVTQALYSVTLYAEATRLALSAGKQDVAAENLRELHNMAREAMVDMRMLIFELHPPVLEEEGLVAALQARLAAVETRAGSADRDPCGGGKTPAALHRGGAVLDRRGSLQQRGQARQGPAGDGRACSFDDEDVCLEIADDGVGLILSRPGERGHGTARDGGAQSQRIQGTAGDHRAPREQGTTVRVDSLTDLNRIQEGGSTMERGSHPSA